jgi:hypothetical protein
MTGYIKLGNGIGKHTDFLSLKKKRDECLELKYLA